MAPSRVSDRNKREADYSNIGVAGRKTGVTLKDTGIRDEHGLEPLDHIFSSPEKSPPKRNGTNHSSTIGEESMDIGESTIPEPTEVLTSRRNGKPILPPPRARSPIKTSLGSSPRRSVGPTSSPLRRKNGTPTRASSHPLVNRRLDFSTDKLRQSIERSPQKGRPLLSTTNGLKKRNLMSAPDKGKKRAFDLSAESDEEAEAQESTSVLDGPDTSANFEISYEDSGPIQNGDESLQLNGDGEEEEPVAEEEAQEDLENVQEEPEAQVKPKRGRPRKSDLGVVEAGLSEVEVQPVAAKMKKKTGRPKANPVKGTQGRVDDEKRSEQPEVTEESQMVDETQNTEENVKVRKGRPRKNQAKEEINNNEPDQAEAGPSKPLKRPKSTPIKAKPINDKRKGPKPPPSRRDPNARITSAKNPKDKDSSTFAKPSSTRPGSRTLTILRSETPAEDLGARMMRSGRTSVKPTAWWRNERIVYGDPTMDGKDLLLPGIKEVIRTEEVIDPRPRAPTYRRKAFKRRKVERVEEEEEEEEEEQEEQEGWEQGTGVLATEVVSWNPLSRRGFEEIEEIELAYSSAAIVAATREVHGADFKYAKTVTLPFFGSGMVDLPPGGEKRVKNARRMQMIFFVFQGRVTVEVAGTSFGIGKGGVWQVPRGNFYSISNPSAKPARIFFAQGCDLSEVFVNANANANGGGEEGSGG